MHLYRNILFVSQGLGDETESLKQAFSTARNHQAALRAVVVCPELPSDMAAYREPYRAMLIERLRQSIAAARESLAIPEEALPVSIEADPGNSPALRVIRQVLRNGHDLVVKEAESRDGGQGFKAMDMELLRKCPCPVWLSRPIPHHRERIRVGVAIDAENVETESCDLSLHLLKVAQVLATGCSGTLHVISCWEYEFEEFLRSNSWNPLEDSEVLRSVTKARVEHRAGLDTLIARSGIGEDIELHHLRGRAERVIPDTVRDQRIDILVMGTVGRTGIPGLLFGNTAEDVAQKLSCSLLALKPPGFVSPVTAY